MELLDIHTHHLAESTFSAIKNIRFLNEEFSPEPGRYYSIGIHPWDVELEDEIDWGLFEELAMHPQVLAVGECGIDKLVHKELLPAQECIFLRQLGIAERLLKPVLIHNVKSTEIISLMKGRSPGLIPWILHGFRGKEPLALQLIRHGFYLSSVPDTTKILYVLYHLTDCFWKQMMQRRIFMKFIRKWLIH